MRACVCAHGFRALNARQPHSGGTELHLQKAHMLAPGPQGPAFAQTPNPRQHSHLPVLVPSSVGDLRPILETTEQRSISKGMPTGS